LAKGLYVVAIKFPNDEYEAFKIVIP